MKTLTFMVAASLLACSACVVHDDGPREDNGTLIVDWTIDGTTDSSKCSQSESDSIEVTVTDLNGDVIGTFDQDCDAFAESISLEPDDYRASAVLVDSNGQPRTTSVPIDRFSIYSDGSLDIPIDFPADSFL